MAKILPFCYFLYLDANTAEIWNIYHGYYRNKMTKVVIFLTSLYAYASGKIMILLIKHF